jgi:integrase
LTPGALKQAVVWGWIGHNPAKQATAPSVQKADVQPPQAEDAARLLSAANAESAELGLFLRLAVVLGARRGEIISLRWTDIDFDRGEVLIAGNVVRVPRQALVHKDTKTHAKRRVAVGADTVEQLRARRVAQAKDALACGTTLVADAYVFSHVPDGSKPIDPDGILTDCSPRRPWRVPARRRGRSAQVRPGRDPEGLLRRTEKLTRRKTDSSYRSLL